MPMLMLNIAIVEEQYNDLRAECAISFPSRVKLRPPRLLPLGTRQSYTRIEHDKYANNDLGSLSTLSLPWSQHAEVDSRSLQGRQLGQLHL
jgi:hypothetical protein